ncbi:MAG: insulinase family protein [Clostridiales bacterium]|nr:insulinase family protein [Clostridiales bacterium]
MENMMKNIPGANDRMHDEWLLPNGLRVVGERLPYLRSVSIGAWMHVGSMMEEPQENGLSHFLEHMVFKGTTKRTARQIAEEMDAVGGQLNAFTGRDCTCFYAKVIDENLELAVDILSDLVINATMDETELEKERGVILEEISMDEDSPEDLVHDLLQAAQFGEQSPGQPILGPAEQIAAYTREDLLAFRKKHYAPKETVIALAGSYEPDKVLQWVTAYFGGWENEISPVETPDWHVLTGVNALREKDSEQMHICLGFPGAAYATDRVYPLAVANNILGGAMSSRLFQRIREDLGLAYSVYSYPNTYKGVGTFGLYAGVSPKNAELVLQEIRAELKKFVDEGITEKEFRDSITQLRAGYLMGLESPGARMQALGRSTLLRSKPLSHEATLKAIEAVTMEKVVEVAREVLTQEPCIAIVGKGAEQVKLD